MLARERNIRLTVKNSGHDYVGRSSGANSLSIWVHHMKKIVLHQKAFSLTSCNTTIYGAAITAGAGSQMAEIYKATAEINHTVVGGNGRTVALGGFISGAGHSLLSPRYGLAADRVLEMEMVTPKGEILTLNECQNTDLFWAARGGGASTFGILTSITSQLVPSPKVLNLDVLLAAAAEDAVTFDWITGFVRRFPSFADKGISGYPIIFNSVPNFLGGGSRKISGIKARFIMTDASDENDLSSIIRPIIINITSSYPNTYVFMNSSQFSDWNSWFNQNFDSSPTGHDKVVGSRLLDKNSLTANETALRIALEEFSAGGEAAVFLVSGNGVHNAKPRGGSNAILPAWRKAYVHASLFPPFQWPMHDTKWCK